MPVSDFSSEQLLHDSVHHMINVLVRIRILTMFTGTFRVKSGGLGYYSLSFSVSLSLAWMSSASLSSLETGRDESFQVRVKEPLGTDSHRTISKNSSGCRLLIGHKKCFVLLCPIGEQFLLSSFREFVHDGYCLATLARFVHQACACKGNFYFLIS